VNFPNAEVTRGGCSVGLTAKEFETLRFMIRNAGRVISRRELLNEVWGYRDYPLTRTVDNHMLKLRQALETDPSHPTHFRTFARVGYKFVP
jgi:DNA-binding response OmpR family regulator